MDWYGTQSSGFAFKNAKDLTFIVNYRSFCIIIFLLVMNFLFFYFYFFSRMENRISSNLKRHLLIQSRARLTGILKMDVSQHLFIAY